MTASELDDATDTETNWAPTRASTAVALAGTAGGVAALSAAAGVTTGAVVAAAGATCLAVALWLLTFEQWRVPAAFAASLLLVPAGAGVATGIGYESLVAFAESFPAASKTRVVGQILHIVGVMAVLWGSTVGVFGAASSVRGVATTRSVSRCLRLVTRVALLPANLFLALAGHALVTNFEPGVFGVVGDFVAAATDWLLAPEPGSVHLFQFGVLSAAASLGVYLALRDLPTRELAGEASVGGVRVADALDVVRKGLGALVVLAVLSVPPAVVVEFVVPAEVGLNILPPAGHDLLVALTSSAGLRTLLWWVTLVSGALAGVATLVRRSSRARTRDLLAGYAPFAAGLVVVAGVAVVHRPVFDALVGFVAGRLEPPLSGRFRDLAAGVAEFYGTETVVLGLTAGVLVLAAGAVFALYVAFALRAVSDRAAGPSLAGGGLFLAAAFAGTLETPLWVVLGGVVAALVVWDAGSFATTLGSEVGRRAETRRVELLHGLTALSVGGAAALAATGLVGVVPTGTTSSELGGLSVALLGAVGGVVLLVMALR
ncbi:DUF7519 family protein [Halorussus caseinilyticus]|uniref:Glycosyl transferase n=1 Tax=Halorussus caseinilyticus TaxID=3034025 RepID=A0ABD5WR49_9EURY|nr:hypothetical protein [Halorussus sp. DT72]